MERQSDQNKSRNCQLDQFFGQEELYTTADRITYILNINKSVFADESEFISTVLHTTSKQLAYEKWHIHHSDIPYKEKYHKLIPINLCVSEPTIHHIIFQNKLMWWHKSNECNRIKMHRWLHTSLHKLLWQKNYYPHQQISNFLIQESHILSHKFLQKIIDIEKRYHRLWKQEPRKLYNQDAFSPEWIRNRNKRYWHK